VSGIIATISLGLFAGRLESRYLDFGRPFLVTMFIYSGVQLLYPILRTPSPFGLGPPESVLALKTLLKLYAFGMKISLYWGISRRLSDLQIPFMIKELCDPHERQRIGDRRKKFVGTVRSTR
jgi:hypothetical protein